MAANHASSSSSVSYISSPEAEPTVASAAASSEITTGVEVASPQRQDTTLNDHRPNDDSRDGAPLLVAEMKSDIERAKSALNGLKGYVDYVSEQITEASKSLDNFDDLGNPRVEGPTQGPMDRDVQRDITELKKDVKKLMLLIPSNYKAPTEGRPPHEKRLNTREDKGKVPNFFKNGWLACRVTVKDFKALYDGLSNKQKLCLLCFSVFPVREIIKKRFVFNWWTAEGFVAPVRDSEKTAEELANEVFRELMAKEFIEPYSKKRTLDCLVNKCRMHPFVRAVVIELARRANFFDFDAEGKLTGGYSSYWGYLSTDRDPYFRRERDNVHMFFNVDNTVLDDGLYNLFWQMKNINLLCLGRWQASSRHHIEVGGTKFLEGLKCMKNLKFLSLQGISQIKELPISVPKLANLTILDLRACPELENIPGEIGLLKSLTHLDVSKCYLLHHMPKEISNLLELEVLKGFVVGNSMEKENDSCTLEHLVKLTKLRKLSIYTRWENFPVISDLRALNRLKKLHKLRIDWGGVLVHKSESITKVNNSSDEEGAAVESSRQENHGHADTEIAVNKRESNNPINAAVSRATPSTSNRCNFLSTVIPSHLFRRSCTAGLSSPTGENDASPELPPQLEKLDLRCLPQKSAPDWLRNSKLNKIKKLYIEGGPLSDLGQLAFQEKSEYEVEILRLKYLKCFEMNWWDLRKLFPKLIYFEIEKCPNLQFSQCDEQGVWMEKPNKLKSF